MPVKETIINHFIEHRKRLLGDASLPNAVHPNDIQQLGDIELNPSGSISNSLDFKVIFQVELNTVFYFGTITENDRIVNEAIAGRRADGTNIY